MQINAIFHDSGLQSNPTEIENTNSSGKAKAKAVNAVRSTSFARTRINQ